MNIISGIIVLIFMGNCALLTGTDKCPNSYGDSPLHVTKNEINNINITFTDDPKYVKSFAFGDFVINGTVNPSKFYIQRCTIKEKEPPSLFFFWAGRNIGCNALLFELPTILMTVTFTIYFSIFADKTGSAIIMLHTITFTFNFASYSIILIITAGSLFNDYIRCFYCYAIVTLFVAWFFSYIFGKTKQLFYYNYLYIFLTWLFCSFLTLAHTSLEQIFKYYRCESQYRGPIGIGTASFCFFIGWSFVIYNWTKQAVLGSLLVTFPFSKLEEVIGHENAVKLVTRDGIEHQNSFINVYLSSAATNWNMALKKPRRTFTESSAPESYRMDELQPSSSSTNVQIVPPVASTISRLRRPSNTTSGVNWGDAMRDSRGTFISFTNRNLRNFLSRDIPQNRQGQPRPLQIEYNPMVDNNEDSEEIKFTN